MSFDTERGILRLADGLQLDRQLHRGELARHGHGWEEWLHCRDGPVGYRWMGHDASHGEALVLIVLFPPEQGPLREWQLAPLHLLEGSQARPDGPCTRALCRWFLERHGAVLPCKRVWGDIDATHDPRNLSTTILCRYDSPS